MLLHKRLLEFRSHSVPEYGTPWALMWTRPFFNYPRQNLGTVSAPKHYVETLCAGALFCHFRGNPLFCIHITPCYAHISKWRLTGQNGANSVHWQMSLPRLPKVWRNSISCRKPGTKCEHSQTFLKGAVSRQSSAFCLILPITRPQLLWNLK